MFIHLLGIISNLIVCYFVLKKWDYKNGNYKMVPYVNKGIKRGIGKT